MDRPNTTAAFQSASKQNDLEAKLGRLRTMLSDLGSVLVAYSGGADSSFLLKIAVDQLGVNCLAVTGDSATIPRSELEQAQELAGSIGARHEIIVTGEMNDPDFLSNPSDRCYHCKKTLFGRLTELAAKRGINHVVEGSNLDDLDDYRPGMRAVAQFDVRSPLKDAGLTKDDIRRLSRRFGLPTWDKPAAPCLSSRIPYGSMITPDKLHRIEAAEKCLRSLGFNILRVRDHDEIARIELPRDEMPRLLDDKGSAEITARFKALGYRYVTIDLSGFRSGSLNEALKGEPDGQG